MGRGVVEANEPELRLHAPLFEEPNAKSRVAGESERSPGAVGSDHDDMGSRPSNRAILVVGASGGDTLGPTTQRMSYADRIRR